MQSTEAGRAVWMKLHQKTWSRKHLLYSYKQNEHLAAFKSLMHKKKVKTFADSDLHKHAHVSVFVFHPIGYLLAKKQLHAK